MLKTQLRRLAMLTKNDDAIRRHIEAEHGGFDAFDLEALAEPGYTSLWLMHHSKHSNDSRVPVGSHWHGNEGDEPSISDVVRLAWEIEEAKSEEDFAAIATRAATQEAIDSGAMSAPAVLEALTHSYASGVRADALFADFAERVYGPELDESALYGANAAELLAERAKDRAHHAKAAAIPAAPEMSPEEMRKLIELNERLVAELSQAAMHDALTGLANRRLFTEQLAMQIARAQRNGESVGVVFVDLDRFKAINDTLGHDVGDDLLCEVARRLTASVRAGDLVSRMGGDEFVIMLSNVDPATVVEAVVAKLAEALTVPMELVDGQIVEITASIGLAIAPKDGCDPEALVRLADQAMYHVKRDGRNGFASA